MTSRFPFHTSFTVALLLTASLAVTSHRRLLAALASGKPETAAHCMATHIENSMEWVAAQESGDTVTNLHSTLKARVR